MYKKAFFLIITAFIACGNLQAKKLSATLNYATFWNPTEGTYIETYLSVSAATIEMQKIVNGKYQGAVEILVTFKKGEDIVNFNKYELLSPEFSDSSLINSNFIDLQRYRLAPGTYSFEISLTDKFRKSSSFKTSVPVEIIFDEENVLVSGIQMIESFKKSENGSSISKSGFDMVPHPSSFFPEFENKISFYAEVYNSEKILGVNEKYLITTYLQPKESNRKLDEYTRHKREKTSVINVVFSDYDISKLPSGNYYYCIEVRDKENKLIAYNSVFFQRSNPGLQSSFESAMAEIDNSFISKFTAIDTMAMYIKYLRPIAGPNERIFIDQKLKNVELKNMQAFFLYFWKERNSSDPESAWLTYLSEVENVNRLYSSTHKKGFVSDRGRVFLQYGPPNVINDNPFDAGSGGITSDTEINRGVSGSVPYQIWHYYSLKNQRNKIFVFYNPHLVPNEYDLIHSDAQGELHNNQWKAYLRRGTIQSLDPESSRNKEYEASPQGQF